MSEPFLWGSQISLPSGIRMPNVTALMNGTFLVLGKAGTLADEKIEAWIYNADGSLKAEQILDVPDPGPRSTADDLDLLAIDPTAVELPGGRIAITWTVNTPSSGGTYVAPWVGIYDGNLKPVGVPKPVFNTNSGDKDYAEAIVALGDGTLVISDRNEKDGHAYLRVFSPDGTRSPALDLGTAGGNVFDAVLTDLATLSDGNVAVVVQTNTSTLKGYVLTPSGSIGPSLSTPFVITASAPPTKGDVKVTALKGGGFVVTWLEAGQIGANGSEPSITAKFQIYDAEGAPARQEPFAFYTSATEAAAIGTPDVIALPGGGFAFAAQVVSNNAVSNSEVRLAIFDASGSQVSDKLLVSKPAPEGVFSLSGLSLLADGRIAVHLSSGIQIVDPRSEAVSLKGTDGDDQYIGTAFNDTFDGGAGADVLNGGDGIDFVSFASAKAGVIASLSGGSGGDAAGDRYIGIEGILGSSFADVLTGNGAAILKGRAGDDTYDVTGQDSVEEAAHEGRDTVIAHGSYALRADAEIEVLRLSGVSSGQSADLTGSDTDNAITGHAGTNTLRGLGGNDTIDGGAGNDRLYGGAGRDVFVFDTALSAKKNVDRIADFNHADDAIWLDHRIFTKIGKGSLANPLKIKAGMFFKGRAAHDASDRIIYDSKTGALSYDKDGTGSAAQVKIATLNKGLKLSYHDFFVI